MTVLWGASNHRRSRSKRLVPASAIERLVSAGVGTAGSSMRTPNALLLRRRLAHRSSFVAMQFVLVIFFPIALRRSQRRKRALDKCAGLREGMAAYGRAVHGSVLFFNLYPLSVLCPCSCILVRTSALLGSASGAPWSEGWPISLSARPSGRRKGSPAAAAGRGTGGTLIGCCPSAS